MYSLPFRVVHKIGLPCLPAIKHFWHSIAIHNIHIFVHILLHVIFINHHHPHYFQNGYIVFDLLFAEGMGWAQHELYMGFGVRVRPLSRVLAATTLPALPWNISIIVYSMLQSQCIIVHAYLSSDNRTNHVGTPCTWIGVRKMRIWAAYQTCLYRNGRRSGVSWCCAGQHVSGRLLRTWDVCTRSGYVNVLHCDLNVENSYRFTYCLFRSQVKRIILVPKWS
jgi:hypothetical protein